jgi:chromosome segregation ATPase
MEQDPKLLADLNDTVGALSKQLASARSALSSQESQNAELKRQLKDCEVSKSDCSRVAAKHETSTRELADLQDRIQSLDEKLAFLREEEKSLRNLSLEATGRNDAASSLTHRLTSTKAFMQGLLQQSLANAVEDWKALSAEAHYRLAVAQQPRIQPGLAPPE